jgi:ADP-ribose pyrophosphatase
LSAIWTGRLEVAEEKMLSSETEFDGRRLKVKIDAVKMPSGRESTREVVEVGDAVTIVPVDERGNILMVRQYRYPVGRELLELPAGGIDGDESPEEAVIREMQEETGYRPGRVERLGGFYSAPGFCTEYLYLYLAAELTVSRLYDEDTEMITLECFTPDEIRSLIESGEIEDAKSIAGLLTWMGTRK